MIPTIQFYPEYKESDVPWIGTIPSHWDIERSKWLFRNIKEINTHNKSTNILSLTLRGVVNNDPNNPEGLVPKDYGTYQIFKKGDLVFKLIDLENLRTSRVGLVHEDGIMSSAYVRLVPGHTGIQKYFFYQYFDLYLRGVFNQLGAGVRSTLGAFDLLNLEVLVPPLDEQAAIVRYLDHMDRLIKRYIHAKQKEIKLLNEQKQAIIQHAVTRGVNPDVKLKPSGVEWLGNIPEHWEVKKLKYEMNFLGGGTPSKANASYWDGDIPWVSPKDMKTELIIDAEDHITKQAILESSTQLIPKGTILMVVRSGILQRIIPIAQCSREVAINQDMKALITKGRILPEYFILLVRGCENELLAAWTKQGATVESIEFQFLSNSQVPIPSLQEQKRIIQYIKDITINLSLVVNQAYRAIHTVNEYRTRLIADVVTGKLDVREAAKHLPEELAALEPDEVITEEDALEEELETEQEEGGA